jgi:hypothetical protein
MDMCLKRANGGTPPLHYAYCKAPLFIAELRDESVVGTARCCEDVRSDVTISCAAKTIQPQSDGRTTQWWTE